MLVSCDDDTMQKILAFKHSVPTLCMPSKPGTGLRHQTLTSQGLRLQRMRHRMLGGVTNGNLTLGFRGLNFAFFGSPLRRSIKHVIDFGLRPDTCSEKPSFKHYLGLDILRMADLSMPVVYKSPHFCRTGWGSRKLALSELACALDLPSQLIPSLTHNGIISAFCFHSSFSTNLFSFYCGLLTFHHLLLLRL